MAIDFEIIERKPSVGPDLTLVRAEFRPVPGEPVHSNVFHMQLYPTGRRLLVDGLGRLVTESGKLVAPIVGGDLDGLFPDEDPRDLFRRETFARNNDAEMVANIEAYWEQKLKAAAAGKPWPQHHNTTLNLQVGVSADDAEETVSSGSMSLTNTNIRIGDLSVDRHAGFRFTGVSGLSGATIDSATLTFRANVSDSGAFVGDWFAHDVEAPGTFTSTNSNISDTGQRPRTTATCEGDGSDFGNWTGGSDETFDGPAPGIKGIVQELADSYDPSAIALLHILTSGGGERIARAYDGDTALAAKLTINFTGGAAATSLLPRSRRPMKALLIR